MVGAWNMSNEPDGLMIGLFNYAERVGGAQIGIININEEGWLPVSIGLNFCIGTANDGQNTRSDQVRANASQNPPIFQPRARAGQNSRSVQVRANEGQRTWPGFEMIYEMLGFRGTARPFPG